MTKEEISKKSSSMQSSQVKNPAPTDIRIDPDLERILPPLPEPQMAELRRSIQGDGQQFPILVNSSGIIIDGANRYKICKSLGIEPVIKVVTIDGSTSRQLLAIKINLFRRQSNSFQRIELLLALEDSYKKAAKELQLSKLRNSRNIALASSLVQNYNNEREETKGQRTEQQNGRTIDHLAKFVDVSPSTFAHGKCLHEHASEQMKIQLRASEITIDNAYREMRKVEKDKSSGAYDRRSELSEDDIIPRSEEICASEPCQENNSSAQNASRSNSYKKSESPGSITGCGKLPDNTSGHSLSPDHSDIREMTRSALQSRFDHELQNKVLNLVNTDISQKKKEISSLDQQILQRKKRAGKCSD